MQSTRLEYPGFAMVRHRGAQILALLFAYSVLDYGIGGIVLKHAPEHVLVLLHNAFGICFAIACLALVASMET